MVTEVLKLEAGHEAKQAALRGAEVLSGGGLVVFPTETVYGVGVRADDARAVGRLRTLKKRDPDRAFTVHVGTPTEAARFAPSLSRLAERLIRKGWPGPMTLILPVDDPDAAAAM